MGSLAYVGSEKACVELNGAVASGWTAFWLWKSIYLSNQVTSRTRCLIIWDWTKEILFGRDFSRLAGTDN